MVTWGKRNVRADRTYAELNVAARTNHAPAVPAVLPLVRLDSRDDDKVREVCLARWGVGGAPTLLP